MNRAGFIFFVLFLSVLALSAQGHHGIGRRALEHKLMELPAIQSTDSVLVYSGFIVNYNTEILIPNWVAYELIAEEVAGEIPRAKGFSMDLDYKGRQAMREDYSNSGWDKAIWPLPPI